MENYPKPAADLVAALTAKAAADPAHAAAFQGAPGAYSHMATMEVCPGHTALPCFTFEDALDAVTSGRASVAVIPIENSRHGRVADIHFLLPESGLHIIGEHFLRVRHCLLGLPGSQRADITEALSHTQALGQCRVRLREWGIRQVQYADTAGAAALVAETGTPTTAAVASSLAATLYGLDVLESGIEDDTDNTTRFVVLARDPINPDPATSKKLMTSAVFQTRSVPAALFKALGGFATNSVNLTKLESYLVGAGFQAAQFYIDFDGSPRDAAVANALEELHFFSKWVRILGTYEQKRDGL
jgi:prephenate dehydratase